MRCKELKSVNLNVRGLNDQDKRCKVFQWLTDINSDVTFLQETFCTEKLVSNFNSNWQGVIEHAISDSPHSRGVCILFKGNNNVIVENKHASEDGRILLLNVEIDGKNMTLINT